MEHLVIEPYFWRLAAGWALVGGIVGVLIGAALQFIPNIPRGGAAVTFAFVLALVGAGAWYGELVDVQTRSAMDEVDKRSREVVRLTREEDARRPHAAIRINSESQRGAAATMEASLKRNGVIVSGIELIDPETAPKTLEVRYFRTNDGRSADAVSRIISGDLVQVPGFASAPAGWYDIWLPKAAK